MPNSDANDDLEGRILRLENACRRCRAVSAVSFTLAIVACIVIAMQQYSTHNELSVNSLKVKGLEVMNENGKTVISMNGFGGGCLSVDSDVGHDHSVTIKASRLGAEVTVQTDHEPRQVGELKIMDDKPYVQLYEVGKDGVPTNMYQAPMYNDAGVIAPEWSNK